MKRRKKLLKQGEQTAFLTSLAELMASGYPLGQGLDMLSSSQEKWRPAISLLQSRLAAGKPLDKAFEDILADGLLDYLTLARAHGRFSETLSQLAMKMNQLKRYQRQLKQALTYPVFLIFLLFLMTLGLEKTLYPVFEQLTQVSVQAGQGNFALLALHGLFFFLMFFAIGLGILYWVLLKMPALKRLLLLSGLPVLASPVRFLMTALFAEQLGLLLGAGLPLPEIIAFYAKDSNEKASLNRSVALAAQEFLAAGGSLEDFLRQQQYLQPTLSAYLNRGFDEQTLAAYLTYYAKVEFDHFDRFVKRFFTLLQPVLFALVGLIILLIYLAMLLPLYQNLGGYPV
ncbi:type II secretion system F family protein [Fructobacillus papyrifericola]|uniref:Type II secretion system protein GspF domain-containing protein n=1 Tax=Fructobacillus papyrifericola TaxID=2713172 RepID=A0ABS5QR25_9LACO|nr:type II secretion system F family protein [Fructobacillus papyrifericola]MBS9335648.1 hypothetical protein [Fructobacillus papyrifericola]